MGWTERQHALLRGLGLRVWAPAVAFDGDSDGDGEVDRDRGGDVGTGAGTAPPAAPAAPTKSAATLRAVPTKAPAITQVAAPSPGVAALEPVSEGRGAQITNLDWPALRDAVADCRACGLCAARTQTVFGMGSTRAHWLVVGEAPGEQEDRQGLPFVGPSGELLDAMLRALQLTRAEDGPAADAQRVYIANTIKCRPPGNRNPAPDELARCEPFLVRQIALLRPRIILAMGRFAVQSLLRSSEPVGRLRGRVHTYQGVPLVVTYHPAYLLRNPADKARSWDDLCLAAATAERAG
jgi:uracil-DNA glycosylase